MKGLAFAVSLLLIVWMSHFCAGQTGECPVVTSQLTPVTAYSRVSELYYTSCGWLMTCARTRYRQVSMPAFTTTYSSTFRCCSGYTVASGNTCSPVCSPACQNGGVCSSPNTCNCTSQWTGETCQTPVCSNACTNGGTCSAPDTCSCPPQWTGNTCQTDVDECSSSGTNNCQQTCMNMPGTFMCGCNSGYTLDSNGNTCTDINECSTSDNDCDQICTNTDGTYQCSCDPGYMLRNNQRRCSDINECSSGADNCQQSCTNTEGSFTCSCTSGYSLHSNGYSCIDDDECTSGTHNCQQECINTPGSFMCSCRDGYINASDTTCTDIDECASRTHGCQQICVNTLGSYRCECASGLVLGNDGRSCQAGAPPSTAPTLLALHRASDTTAILSWIPLTAGGSDIIAYKLVYQQVTRDNGCSSLGPDSDGAPSMVVRGEELEAVISGLNPGEEYCLWIAGVSIYGVGVFSNARRLSLFTNTPFQVLLITNEMCSSWLADNQDGKLYDVTTSVSVLMGQMCDCSLTTNHIVDERLLCNQADSNEVVFEGKMVSLPTTSSQDMVQLLHTYATSKEASLTVQGETIIVEPCLSGSGDSAQCVSPHTTTTVAMVTDGTSQSPFPLVPVVAGAGGGLLLVALVLVLVGCGCGFCLARRKNGSRKEYSSHDLPVSSIEMRSHPKQLEADQELYADISDIKPTQNGSYISTPAAAGGVGGLYTSIGQQDEGNSYTTTRIDRQDTYMYMASQKKNAQMYQEIGETGQVENIYSLPKGENPLDYEQPVMSGRQLPLPPQPNNESGYY